MSSPVITLLRGFANVRRVRAGSRHFSFRESGFPVTVSFVNAVRNEEAKLDALPISAKEKERIRFAAGLLSARGAKRVVLFGSLARGQKPTVHSDFDFAVEGLPGDRYLECLGELLQRMPRPVDLVELEHAPGFLRERIEKEGILIEIREN